MQEVRARNQMFVCDLTRLNPQIQKMIVRTRDEQGHEYFDTTKLVDYLNRKFNPRKKSNDPDRQLIVAIVHNRDASRNGDGTVKIGHDNKPILRDPHLHVGRHTKNATTLKSFAVAMMEPSERIETKQNVDKFEKKYGQHNWENLVSYLFHHTKNALKDGKFVYPFEWGAGNFDFRGLVNRATADAEKAGNRKRSKAYEMREEQASEDELVDFYKKKILAGEVDPYDYLYDSDLEIAYLRDSKKLEKARDMWAHKVLSAYQNWQRASISVETDKYMHNPNRLKVDEKLQKRWKDELDKLNFVPQISTNYYFEGPAGVGKTTLANYVAGSFDDENRPRGVYVARGKKNQFDEYEGQHAIVLDDLRSNSLSAETWTQILDPNMAVRAISKRYHNGIAVGLKNVSLTNTQSLEQFGRYIHGNSTDGDDDDDGLREPVEQYYRRFKGVFKCKTFEVRHDDEAGDLGVLTYDYYDIIKPSDEELAEMKAYRQALIEKQGDNGFLFTPLDWPQVLHGYEHTGPGEFEKHETRYYLQIRKRDRHLVLPLQLFVESGDLTADQAKMWSRLDAQDIADTTAPDYDRDAHDPILVQASQRLANADYKKFAENEKKLSQVGKVKADKGNI